MTTPSPQPAKPALRPEEAIQWHKDEANNAATLAEHFHGTSEEDRFREDFAHHTAMASTIRGLVEALEEARTLQSEDFAASPEDLERLRKDADLTRLPTPLTYHARRAMGGEGDMAYTWSDKPHRVVFNLCGALEAIEARARSAFGKEGV